MVLTPVYVNNLSVVLQVNHEHLNTYGSPGSLHSPTLTLSLSHVLPSHSLLQPRSSQGVHPFPCVLSRWYCSLVPPLTRRTQSPAWIRSVNWEGEFLQIIGGGVSSDNWVTATLDTELHVRGGGVYISGCNYLLSAIRARTREEDSSGISQRSPEMGDRQERR